MCWGLQFPPHPTQGPELPRCAECRSETRKGQKGQKSGHLAQAAGTAPSLWWVTLHAHPPRVWLHGAQGLSPHARSTSPLETSTACAHLQAPKQICPGPLHDRLPNRHPPHQEIYRQDHGFYKTMARQRHSAMLELTQGATGPVSAASFTVKGQRGVTDQSQHVG